jgi:4-cresol dehydrogenase (hydroxylating)
MIASERQYPWELTADRTPLIPGQLNRLDSPWKDSEWVGVGALYSASKKHGMADRCLVKKLLGGQVESLVFFDAWKSRLARWFERPLRWLTGVDVGEVIQNLYEKPVFLGFPTERSTKSTYWRKRMPVPEDMDPDRDRCGVIWLCPVVPFEGSHIVKAIDRVTTIAYEFGFEPQIAFIFPSERAVYLFPSIIYDREVSGEDERAMACHDRMLKVMVSEGYFPYRLGIQSMASMPAPTDGYDGLVGQIKHLLDPHNVLAPGRYQIIGDTDSSGCQRGTSQDPETQWGEPHSMSCDKLGDNGVAMGSVWSV